MNLRRSELHLLADPQRVVARPFFPGNRDRIRAIIGRILAIPEENVLEQLSGVLKEFSHRHRNLLPIYWDHFELAAQYVALTEPLSEERCLLIGSYFTSEYSLEAAALFNPSMVLHPDQREVEEGSARFALSLRACGEGHISSIEFREGIVDATGEVTMMAHSRFCETGKPQEDALYDQPTFVCKLTEMGSYTPSAERILSAVPDPFTLVELRQSIVEQRQVCGSLGDFPQTAETMLWVAQSNYRVSFAADSEISERVIFPVTESESRGIEDARFVRFVEADGSVMYYGTYTAYNGHRVLPQLIETPDFRSFKVSTLTGRCVQNKGMALFPRRIQGRFATISRIDGESMYLMYSDNPYIWNDAQRIRGPQYPWDLMIVGNCGSPVEVDEGWLLLTHGVGPMRRYSISMVLLDKDDPSCVLAALPEPLIQAGPDERDGYVPNVVYSCGMMKHGDQLIIPYALCDSSTPFITLSIADVLERLKCNV